MFLFLENINQAILIAKQNNIEIAYLKEAVIEKVQQGVKNINIYRYNSNL